MISHWGIGDITSVQQQQGIAETLGSITLTHTDFKFYAAKTRILTSYIYYSPLFCEDLHRVISRQYNSALSYNQIHALFDDSDCRYVAVFF